MENVSEDVDPLLDPVLEQRFVRKVCVPGLPSCVCLAHCVNVFTRARETGWKAGQ